MTDLNVASTSEVSTTDWQLEYQKLFVKLDQYLTRAIEAEKKLKVVKELLAEQEIKIANFRVFAQTYREAVRLARDKAIDANKILDNVNWGIHEHY